ncbi:MAG: DUF4476 domain-containing protein [Bradymonadales bacterium]
MKTRQFILVLIILFAFPFVAQAKNVYLEKNATDAIIGRIADSANSYDRMIGKSAADQKQRNKLYDEYDKLVKDINAAFSLFRLVQSSGKLFYQTDDQKMYDALTRVLSSTNRMITACNNAKNLSKEEYRKFYSSLSELNNDVQRAQAMLNIKPYYNPQPDSDVYIQPSPDYNPQPNPGYNPQPNPGYNPQPNPGYYNPQPDNPYYYYPRMDENEFNSLLQSIKRESFDDSKLIIVNSAAEYSYFSVSQVVEILKSFTFEEAKVKTAIKLYPRTIDPGNWYKVYGLFTFDSTKQSIRNGISKLQPAYPSSGYYPILSKSDFKDLHRAVSRENFDSSRQILLENASQSIYFRVDQVVDLMKIFSSSKGKVNTAIMLYPRVIDAKNWYKVYSVLSFDSDKKAIQNGISSLQPAAY